MSVNTEHADLNVYALASAIARLILAGDPRYLPGVRDYGRVIANQGTPSEVHRLTLNVALSQPRVCDAYITVVRLLGDDYPARAAMLRQIAIYIYARS